MVKNLLPTTLSAASYASAVVFVRFAYASGLTPGTAIFLRFIFASLILGVFLKLSRRWRSLTSRQIFSLLLLGFLAYTVMGVTWFIALDTTPAWLVALSMAVFPLIVSLGSWFFLHEKIGSIQIAALAAVITGGVLIFWQPIEGSVTIGLILMAVNLLVNAAYYLIGTRYTRGIPPMLTAFWMIAGAAAGTFLYALVSGDLSLRFQPDGWLWVVMFSILSTAVAISLLWWGISLLGPSKAAIVGTIEPVFTIGLAVLVLGERLLMLQVAGAALILLGVLLVRFSR